MNCYAVERLAGLVRSEDVKALAAHEGGGARNRVEKPLHDGPDPLLARPAPAAAAGRDVGAREGGTGAPARPRELQCPGDGLEDVLGDAAHVPPLEAHVVLGADPGAWPLLAAQALHPPVGAVGGEARLLGGDLRPPLDEEISDLGPRSMRFTVRTFGQDEGVPASTRLNGDSLQSPSSGPLTETEHPDREEPHTRGESCMDPATCASSDATTRGSSNRPTRSSGSQQPASAGPPCGLSAASTPSTAPRPWATSTSASSRRANGLAERRR